MNTFKITAETMRDITAWPKHMQDAWDGVPMGGVGSFEPIPHEVLSYRLVGKMSNIIFREGDTVPRAVFAA